MTLALPTLRLGIRTPDVGNWQLFLNERGFRDPAGRPLVVDEAFGPRTAHATVSWQRARHLSTSGEVTLVERRVAAVEGYVPFLLAKNFTPASRGVIDLIVIHDMEYPEVPTGAEWCAQFFAGSNAPRASTHYSVDSNSVVQSVRDRDVAWHAPGANHNGIGIEHAGYAKQSRQEWLDPYSLAELVISAHLVRKLCDRYAIPIVRLSAADLTAKKRGITGHADVTKAFPGPGRTHWDPGPNFPWDKYIQLVDEAE